MIIFTDLDNCLLDSKYSASSLKDFAGYLLTKGITISIISSKTEKEIKYHLDELNIDSPYGAENGCIVVVEDMRYEMGEKKGIIKSDLVKISRRLKVKIELFSEIEDSLLKEITGLSGHLLALARKRLYSEPFRIIEGNKDRFIEELKKYGYSVNFGGKFFQITKGCSKRKAVTIIKDYFNDYSVGIGDSPNDYPMLDETDYPVILNSEGNPKYRNYKGYGPETWKEVILEALENLNV